MTRVKKRLSKSAHRPCLNISPILETNETMGPASSQASSAIAVNRTSNHVIFSLSLNFTLQDELIFQASITTLLKLNASII